MIGPIPSTLMSPDGPLHWNEITHTGTRTHPQLNSSCTIGLISFTNNSIISLSQFNSIQLNSILYSTILSRKKWFRNPLQLASIPCSPHFVAHHVNNSIPLLLPFLKQRQQQFLVFSFPHRRSNWSFFNYSILEAPTITTII